jgi:uncharacterized membrane protein YedE/YeeE
MTSVRPPAPREGLRARAVEAAPPRATAPVDFECADVEQVPQRLQTEALEAASRGSAMVAYFVAGLLLGVLFLQSEVASWFRIQEMFRFQSWHMYGVIGSAVAVAALSVWAIRAFGVRTLHGEPIEIQPKAWGTSRLRGARYWLGGTVFGVGWALIGACPGPMFALVGSGLGVMVAGLLAAMAGTWAYGLVQHRLPH